MTRTGKSNTTNMPREKLTLDPQGNSLALEELLAIVIGTGSAQCPVM